MGLLRLLSAFSFTIVVRLVIWNGHLWLDESCVSVLKSSLLGSFPVWLLPPSFTFINMRICALVRVALMAWSLDILVYFVFGCVNWLRSFKTTHLFCCFVTWETSRHLSGLWLRWKQKYSSFYSWRWLCGNCHILSTSGGLISLLQSVQLASDSIQSLPAWI